jgi:hypothetical protein
MPWKPTGRPQQPGRTVIVGDGCLADVAKALWSGLVSPNVSDSNFEAANVVDVIQSVADAIRSREDAEALQALAVAVKEGAEAIAGGLNNIARALAKDGVDDLENRS